MVKHSKNKLGFKKMGLILLLQVPEKVLEGQIIKLIKRKAFTL